MPENAVKKLLIFILNRLKRVIISEICLYKI